MNYAFTTSAAAALFNRDILGFEDDHSELGEYTIEDILDCCFGVEIPQPSVTQEEIKAQVADLYERYVELKFEIEMNEIYREVYRSHGLLEAYEAWKATPARRRRTKSFIGSLPSR